MIPQCARLAAGNDDWLWFDDPAIEELWPSTLETLSMVGLSSLIAVVFGALLGVVLKATRRDGLLPAPAVNAGLGFIVNIGRSIPFVIIMCLLIPFSRFVTGTGSGWLGATIPLGIAAIPYFARMVESNLDGVEQGKVEAAQMMGASRGKILTGVLVRESMPALIQSTTILVITLVGYSAMAGLIGGGGLGFMAQSYGYNQSVWSVLIIIVVVIVVIVQIVQLIGDMLSRLVDHR